MTDNINYGHIKWLPLYSRLSCFRIPPIQNFEIQFNYKMEMLKKIMINYSDNWYQKKPIYLICFILKLQEQTFDFCENFLGGTD